MKKLAYLLLLMITVITCEPQDRAISFCRLDDILYKYTDRTDPIHEHYVTATLHLTYDKHNRLILVEENGLAWQTLLSWKFTTQYTYDDQNHIIEINKLEIGGLMPMEARKVLSYEENWITKIMLYQKNSSGVFVLTDSSLYSYNTFHQLIKQEIFQNGALTNSTEFQFADTQTKNFSTSITNEIQTSYQYDGKKNPFFELNLAHLQFDWIRFSGFDLDYRTSNSVDVQNYYCYQPGAAPNFSCSYNDGQYPVDLALNCGNIRVQYQNSYSCK